MSPNPNVKLGKQERQWDYEFLRMSLWFMNHKLILYYYSEYVAQKASFIVACFIGWAPLNAAWQLQSTVPITKLDKLVDGSLNHYITITGIISFSLILQITVTNNREKDIQINFKRSTMAMLLADSHVEEMKEGKVTQLIIPWLFLSDTGSRTVKGIN